MDRYTYAIERARLKALIKRLEEAKNKCEHDMITSISSDVARCRKRIQEMLQ